MAELGALSKKERNEKLGALVDAASRPRNGQNENLAEMIAGYEKKLGRTVAEVRAALARGEVEESFEVNSLLMLATLRG